jgi:hypothetical protein
MYNGQNPNNVFLKESMKEKQIVFLFRNLFDDRAHLSHWHFSSFVRSFVVAALSYSSQQYFQ